MDTPSLLVPHHPDLHIASRVMTSIKKQQEVIQRRLHKLPRLTHKVLGTVDLA